MKSTHLDEAGRPVMVDVSGKQTTLREAEAECFVRLTPSISEAIRTNNVKKGDVFRIAETAGIMATKKTPDIIPLCHSIRLDHAKIICSLDEQSNSVRVFCSVKAGDVTGVEMEALTGASVAALTIYDMCKGIDKGMTIDGLKLLRKSGGKSGDYFATPPLEGDSSKTPLVKGGVGGDCSTIFGNAMNEQSPLPYGHPPYKGGIALRPISAAILTVSDKGHAGERIDTSGDGLEKLLTQWGAKVVLRDIVPDEKEKIAAKLIEWADGNKFEKIELIITTGGTGLSPRDVTPEALLLVADREVPGFGECMRLKSLAQTPNGILTRGLAVTRGGTLILALPGSERGSRQCFEAVAQALRHGIEILNKWKAECGNA